LYYIAPQASQVKNKTASQVSHVKNKYLQDNFSLFSSQIGVKLKLQHENYTITLLKQYQKVRKRYLSPDLSPI